MIPTRPRAVSACGFENKLHVIWKVNDSGNRICCSSSVSGTGWTMKINQKKNQTR